MCPSHSYNGEALDSFTLLRSANESVITNGVWLTNGATQMCEWLAARPQPQSEADHGY